MKKKSVSLGIAVVLALAMVLCACKKEEEEVEPGWLTITNLPSVPFEEKWGYYWEGSIYFEEEITSRLQLVNWKFQERNRVAYIANPGIHNLYKGTSPFPLIEDFYIGFSKSGVFLVDMLGSGYRVIMNVTFRNGRATIDFNDMTNVYSLPEF